MDGIIQVNGRPYFHYGPLGNTMKQMYTDTPQII